MAYFSINEGSIVKLNDRNKKKLEEIRNNLGGKVYIVPGDVSTKEGAESVISEAVKLMGGLDDLVITIGGYIEDTVSNPIGLEEMLNNHIKIPINVISTSLKYLHYGSTIVLVSAMSAIDKADPSQLSYAIAKAGLTKAVEILTSELIDQGIRVVGIAPSVIDGDFEPNRDWKKLRKLGDSKAPPEDYAKIIVWLLNPDLEWINGVVIPADGGARFKSKS
ncbi:MAG: SDR family NAD(P)-dependent oxidoreductase [Sulfolobaceae archaeon]